MSSPYVTTDLRVPDSEIPEPLRAAPVQQRPSASLPTVAEPTAEQVRAKVEADIDKQTATDALHADATPPSYPEGAPELIPFMKLGFRKRAAWLAKVGPVEDKVKAMPDKGTAIGAAGAAEMYELMAEMDDLLREVAADPDQYDAWVAANSDAAFGDLFTAYMARAQPGEARGSSS